MLRDVHRPAKTGALANLAQMNDRVGVARDVALVQRPLDQPVERRLVRGDQQHAADPAGVVHVVGHRRGVLPVALAEQVAGDPLRVFPQNLMVDVVEQLELDRVARAGRPARSRRPPPAARRGRNCRRRRRSTALSRRPNSACHWCQASKSRSARVTRRPCWSNTCR